MIEHRHRVHRPPFSYTPNLGSIGQRWIREQKVVRLMSHIDLRDNLTNYESTSIGSTI